MNFKDLNFSFKDKCPPKQRLTLIKRASITPMNTLFCLFPFYFWLEKTAQKDGFSIMAEAERFELSVGYEPTPVFKTGAFNRSAKLPWVRIIAKFLNNASLFCEFFKYF